MAEDPTVAPGWTVARAILVSPAHGLMIGNMHHGQYPAEYTANMTPPTLAKTKCVHELVADQAAKSPGALAVVAGSRGMTYRTLEERANQLAQNLKRLGVQPETPVGLCMKRSFAMVVGALGILKAGGAYLPVDPAYPAARLSYILRDARVSAVVTERRIAEQIPEAGYRIVSLEEGLEERGTDPRHVFCEVQAQNLAYVIYTSGSTGHPKGVEIQHDSLSNLVAWHVREFAVTAADRASQFSGVGFDAAVWELWPYLSAGASVHLSPPENAQDPRALRDWLVAQQITISFLPTAIAERVMALDWPKACPLRILLTGAETLRHYPRRGLPFQVVNNYGPTECTVVTTSGVVEVENRSATQPPIGRPIFGTEVYILDETMQPVPINTTGEMYITGVGVARGYRHRPDLTAQKFISSPFSTDPEARLYKTGDLARWLPDGQISFVGRNDEQIKIRGYRIEPGEIVEALDGHPAIRESLVVAHDFAPDDRRLVAYLVLSESAQLTHTAVREYLADRLPEHMIPSLFLRLDAVPLNAHGKVDRTALPKPDIATRLQEETVLAQRTPVERQVTEIVGSLLQLGPIGVEENFFMLGGHSLLGTQLIARLREAFGVELPLRSLFDAPTIRNLAAEIEKLVPARLAAPPGPRGGEISGTAAATRGREL